LEEGRQGEVLWCGRDDIVKTITVRGMEPSLAEKLRQASKKEGKSVNQIVIDTMKKQLGMEKEKKFTVVHHDMDHLFGKWSAEEFNRIQGKICLVRICDHFPFPVVFPSKILLAISRINSTSSADLSLINPSKLVTIFSYMPG